MTSNIQEANKIYEHYNVDPTWFFDVNGLKFPFNSTWKRIAVNLSGGADSALGTSILAKHIKDNNLDTKIYVVTHVRCWNTRPWAGPVSIDVYNKLKEMWGDIIAERIQNFIPPEFEEGAAGPDLIEMPDGSRRSGDRTAVDSFNKYVTSQYKIDAAYNFVTLNPTVDLYKEGYLSHAKQPHDRVESAADVIANPEYQFLAERNMSPNVKTHYGNSWLAQPWKYVEKDFILEQYYKNNWLDLLHITRSCEIDAEQEVMFFDKDGSSTYTASLAGPNSYVHGESDLWECGTKCFWCAERNWAKEQAAKNLGIDAREFDK